MLSEIFNAEKLAGTINKIAFSDGNFSEGVSAARDFMKMVLENSDTVEISPLETTAQFARYQIELDGGITIRICYASFNGEETQFWGEVVDSKRGYRLISWAAQAVREVVPPAFR